MYKKNKKNPKKLQVYAKKLIPGISQLFGNYLAVKFLCTIKISGKYILLITFKTIYFNLFTNS